jgi:Uri superfamily endonuclease
LACAPGLAVAIHTVRHSPLWAVPGTYALLITLDRSRNIYIGRRGRFRFPAGFYLYVGSALGPGGLGGRLERHLRAEKRLHWHVDYLLHARWTRITQVWALEGAARRECDWAWAALQLPGAGLVVPRFGSSDCRCAAHLIGFAGLAKPPRLDAFTALVGGPVHQWMTR